MDDERMQKMADLVNDIEVTEENEKDIKKLKRLMNKGEYEESLKILQELDMKGKIKLKDEIEEEYQEFDEDYAEFSEDTFVENGKKEDLYPIELSNEKLEEIYIGLLLANPKAISMYYIVHDDACFENEEMLNIYKSILFTEGEAYAPQIAKNNFNFAKETSETYNQKVLLKERVSNGDYDFEKTYVEIRKLFEIRKNYLMNPIQEIKNKIVDILKYELYDKMTIDEVKAAIEQITATEKFKRAILSNDITDFLMSGDNNLVNRIRISISNTRQCI